MARRKEFAYRARYNLFWAMRRAILPILLGLLILKPAAARAGETACWFDHGTIVVPAAFGDIAGDFVLDAAEPKSQLHVTNAQSFGILTPTARAALRFAGRRLPAFEMTIADLGDRERPFAAGLAGVIGADALSSFVTEIETSPCRVRLSRKAGRAWAIRLPMKTIGGVFAVHAAVSDGVTSRAGWFAAATGKPGIVLTDARLTRVPPADADPDWPPARLRALSLGGLLFEQVPANVTDHEPPGLAGAIGEEIWSRYRLRFDPQRRVLELAPRAP